MRLALLLAAVSTASAQAPADFSSRPFYDRPLYSFTSERLPYWLKFSGEFRTRFEGRTGFNYQPDNNDGYALVRNRLNVEIAPAPWLGFFFQGQDARVPGLDAGRTITSFKNSFDLRQAYVRFGTSGGLVRLIVGRQLLSYGAQRLIGPSDWSNTSRAWDAVKLELGTANYRVDLFAASVVVNDPTHPDHHHDGFNVHGAYGAFKKVVPHAVVEPYLLWKTGRISIWTGGVRAAVTPGTSGMHGFDYQAEFARQWGTLGSQGDSAQAGYGILGFSPGNYSWKPRLSAEFSYASGDPHPGSATHRTFDQLYPTNHISYGLTDPVGWQNMQMARIGFDAKPHKRLQLFLDYRELYLDQPQDALYSNSGTVAVKPLAGNTARHIGSEIDFSGVWNVSSQWRLGAGVGHLKAGDFLKQNTKGSGQTFPYLFAQYSF